MFLTIHKECGREAKQQLVVKNSFLPDAARLSSPLYASSKRLMLCGKMSCEYLIRSAPYENHAANLEYIWTTWCYRRILGLRALRNAPSWAEYVLNIFLWVCRDDKEIDLFDGDNAHLSDAQDVWLAAWKKKAWKNSLSAYGWIALQSGRNNWNFQHSIDKKARSKRSANYRPAICARKFATDIICWTIFPQNLKVRCAWVKCKLNDAGRPPEPLFSPSIEN